TITVDFDSTEADPFQNGTPPLSALFEGGTASGDGAWIIPEDETGEITFTTPTRSLTIEFENDYQPPVPGLNKASVGDVYRQVDVECGVSNQGNNNSEAYNALMYLRGFTQVEDPGTAANAASRFLVGPENLFINFGNNVYKTEIIMLPDNIAGGRFDYKVADGGWSDDKTWTQDQEPLQLDSPLTLVPGGSGAPNGSFTITEEACYQFELDTTDVNAPILKASIKKEEPPDGGGPDPDPVTGAEVRVYDTNDSLISASETSPVSISRAGGESAIGRVEVENRGGDGDVGVTRVEWKATPDDAPSQRNVEVLYHRAPADYDGVQIEYDDGAGTRLEDCVPNPPGSYGWCGISLDVYPSTLLTYRILINGEEDPAGTIVLNVDDVNDFGQILTFSGRPGWINDGGNPATGDNNAIDANEILVFYYRPDEEYEGWGVHIETTDGTAWTLDGEPHPFEAILPAADNPDVESAMFRITRPQDLPKNGVPAYSANPDPVDTLPPLNIVFRKADEQDPGQPQTIDSATDNNTLLFWSGVNDFSTTPAFTLPAATSGAFCHWVYANETDGNVLACSPTQVDDGGAYELLYSASGTISAGLGKYTGADGVLPLTSGGALTAPDNQLNLSGWPTFSLPGDIDAAQAKELLKYQLVLATGTINDNGFLAVTGTELQTPGALDDLYAAAAANAVLGVDYSTGAPVARVWAPTALSVALNVYDT
ncbi:MAG: hypothetical protein OET16_14360, partial [Chromatiales bacterium]|nr:hypothetical protein [Chromatiales bacterium]